jgi:protein-disulfide isomerase
VVAEGADLSITLEQLDERVKQDLLEERTGGHEARLYELRSDVLDEWIEEQVLENEAERRGVDVETLLAAETAPITQEEVQAFFDQNAARLPAGTTLADVEEPIRQHLGERKRGEAIAALVNQADVQVHLDPPRIDVAAVGPSLGPDDAPVTIIEFGDFQCPYCRRAAPTMQALRERYPQRVRFVYRHLPLESIHPRARAAAEAAICADAQDRFWAFHDRLFAAPGALGDAELRAHAEAVGVDLDAFDACLSEGSPQARIASDIQAARDAGISGTPAFVINGMLVTGAQPIEVFDELIQRDLAAAERAP